MQAGVFEQKVGGLDAYGCPLPVVGYLASGAAYHRKDGAFPCRMPRPNGETAGEAKNWKVACYYALIHPKSGQQG